jgi:hypothetical protein
MTLPVLIRTGEREKGSRRLDGGQKSMISKRKSIFNHDCTLNTLGKTDSSISTILSKFQYKSSLFMNGDDHG